MAMLITRYSFASEHAAGKDVLEVACGSGIGLGLLARRARRVVGGDLTLSLLRMARRQYGTRIPLLRLDALALPFSDSSFDVVLLYEAIYYLRSADGFLAEARRVLRPGGSVLICTVNREWTDFNPSAFNTRYYSADELRRLAEVNGFASSVQGAFPARDSGIAQTLISVIKRAAVVLRAIPKTMTGKQFLKRVFLGGLTPLPGELDDARGGPAPQVSLAPGPVPDYKVIYVIGIKPSSDP